MHRTWIRIEAELAALLLLAVWIAPLSTGQTSSRHNRDAAEVRARGGKPTPVLSDEALERAIRGRFARSAIASNGFTVSVSGGVATVKGIAKVAQHKGVATRLARSAGAARVRNQIEIAPAAREAMRKAREGKGPKAKDARKPGGVPHEPRGATTAAETIPEGRTRQGNPTTESDGVQPIRRQVDESTPPGRASEKKGREHAKRFSLIPPQPGGDQRGPVRTPSYPRRY